MNQPGASTSVAPLIRAGHTAVSTGSARVMLTPVNFKPLAARIHWLGFDGQLHQASAFGRRAFVTGLVLRIDGRTMVQSRPRLGLLESLGSGRVAASGWYPAV